MEISFCLFAIFFCIIGFLLSSNYQIISQNIHNLHDEVFYSIMCKNLANANSFTEELNIGKSSDKKGDSVKTLLPSAKYYAIIISSISYASEKIVFPATPIEVAEPEIETLKLNLAVGLNKNYKP